MDFSDYQHRAWRTANHELSNKEQVKNAIFGMMGELGELVDILKKHYFQGHHLEPEIIEKEIGDFLWYLALLASALDLDLTVVAYRNIEKLKERYPNGFSKQDSIERKV